MREVARAVTLLGLQDLVAELGGDLRLIAAGIGLDLSELQRPEQLLPIRQVHDLVNLAAETLKRKDLGLLWGARSDPSRLGPLFVAVMNAQTARQAVGFLARFLHTSFPMGAIELKPLGRHREIIAVRSLLNNPPPMVQFHERRLGSLHVILRLVCGEAYQPKEVWFSHKQNAASGAYTRVFGVRPMFEMPENGIVVSKSLLDAVRPSANDQVREMALAYLRATRGPHRRSIKAEVAHMVGVLMHSGNPTIAQTARALKMHPRTLQRKMSAEGVTFESTKDEVRRAIAETMLAEPHTPLIQIALSLHYSNMSAFTRSCRRWFGAPPSHVRRSLATPRRKGPRHLLRRVRARL